MDKNKLILMIAAILVVFVLITYLANSLCVPSQNSKLGSFIENNIPKPNNETIDELRSLWTLYYKKFCGGKANQTF
jgi:hypothetical protein